MFDLLEKIYVEVKGHTVQFSNVESRLGTLENDVKKLGVKIDGKSFQLVRLS